MFVRLVIVRSIAGLSGRKTDFMTCPTIANSKGWTYHPAVNAFRVSGSVYGLPFQSGGAMRTGQHNPYPGRDMLDGDARAVVDAEFKEIATDKRSGTLMNGMKGLLQWIRRRLQRS